MYRAVADNSLYLSHVVGLNPEVLMNGMNIPSNLGSGAGRVPNPCLPIANIAHCRMACSSHRS